MTNFYTKNQALYWLILGMFMIMPRINAQQLIKEGKQNERAAYEFNLLKNPNTGKIPENIRTKELTYVYSTPSLKKINKSGNKGKNKQATQSFTWNRRGPFNVGGRTRALAIDRTNENIILAGGVSGGMWRSTNGGASWTQTTGASQTHSVTDVYQDPNNTNIWYHTSGEFRGNSADGGGDGFFRGVGVFKSTDGGITWVLLPSTSGEQFSFSSSFQYAWRVRVDPTNSDVYVATVNGIFRSTDAGISFTLVLAGNNALYTDLEISATGVIYATLGSNSAGSKGVHKSTDGTSWTDVTPTGLAATYNRIVLDIAPSNENILYVFANTPGSGTNDHQLFYTSDAGSNWTNRTTNLPAFGGDVGNLGQGSYNQYIKIKPDNPDVVFIGSLNIYRSTDGYASTGNTTWIGGYSPANNVSTYVNHHPDNHALVFYPSNPARMLTGHDGGISRTEDNLANNVGTFPVTWTLLSNGYYTTQIYGLAIDPGTANDPRLMAGFQDNGKWTATSTSGTANWFEEFAGGDGCYVAIVAGQDIRYTSTQNGKIIRFVGPNVRAPTDADGIQPATATGQLFVNPFILDKTDQNIMYYPAGGRIWRNTDLSAINSGFTFNGTNTGWTNLAGSDAGGSSITTLDVSLNNAAHILYYGTADGKVFRLDNVHTGNPTAVDIHTGKGFPAGAYVSSVSVDPSNSANVLLTFSNYGVQSIFYTTDSGVNWTNVSGNLEEMPDGTGNGPSVRWAEVHRDSNGGVVYLIGASTGLYSTETLNGTSTVWTQEGPNTIGTVPVVMMEGRSADDLVAVGTHGVGLFSGTVKASLCGVPGNLVTSSLTATTTTLDWTAVGGATTYDVRYRLKNTTSWTDVTGIATNTTNLTGLTANTVYEFQVRANCVGGVGNYSGSKAFVTCVETFPYTESFENDLNQWLQDDTDDFDWTRRAGPTASGNTGPGSATDGNTYLYTEASTPYNPAKTARIISPCFNFSNVSYPKITFSYHMFGANMGSLTLEISTNGGASWTSLWSRTGDQGNAWNTQTIGLNAYKGGYVQLRFVGVTGGGFDSDMAIDAISITNDTPSVLRGNFLNVDGANQYISTGSVITNAVDNVTAELWFQWNGTGSGNRMLMYNGTAGSSNGYGLVLNNSNYVVPWVNGAEISNTTTLITANQWHHAALVREAGTLKLYIDGEPQTLGSNPTPTTPTTATYIGANTGGTDAFPGKIEEVRFWSVVRTQAQIRENMHLVLNGSETGSVAYFQFNETSGNAIDIIGANNGTLQNTPARVASDCPIGSGRSQTITVNASGNQDFATTGLQIEFAAGTLPNGDIVVTQIDGIRAPTNIPGDLKTYASSYWVIHNYGTNATFTELVQLTMTLPASDVISANDEANPANLRLYKRDSNSGEGDAWTNMGSANSANAAARTINFTTFTPNFTSFSQILAGTVNTGTSPLPVTLSQFEAVRQGQEQVLLRWETSSELNSLKFEVQKSDNGIDFKTIGSVDAAGNSTQKRTYQYLDQQALNSAYYRLKQIDKDGKFSLSEHQFVQGSDLQALKFFPNPFTKELKMNFGASQTTTLPMRLQVQGTSGKQLINIQGNAAAVQQTLNRRIHQLQKGTYLIKLIIGSKVYIKKVIKE